MRSIKFRGKSLETEDWVYGSYVNTTLQPYITTGTFLSGNIHRVDPETVGQYTGLQDKNGKDVYEDDILKFEKTILVSRQNGEIKETAIAIVRWGHQGFTLDRISENRLRTLDITDGVVIENIFLNPELLTGIKQ